MTCRNIEALLDKLIDGELDKEQVAYINDHIDTCQSCRREVELSHKIKNALAELPDIDPGQPYWQETTELIMARAIGSIETVNSAEPVRTSAISLSEQKSAFFRALVSVAASILILVGAIYLGGLEETQSKRFNQDQSPYLVAAPLQNIFSNEATELVTRDEQIQISKGMMLMGAPGALGRLGLIPDLAASFHQSR